MTRNAPSIWSVLVGRGPRRRRSRSIFTMPEGRSKTMPVSEARSRTARSISYAKLDDRHQRELARELRDRREVLLELVRKRAGELILNDAHRLAGIPQCILDDDLVAPLAQDNADGRLVIRMAQLLVHGRQVKVHLAGELWFEVLDLQLDHHETAQPHVIEEEVEIIVLPADEGEALAEFQNERAQMLDETAFEIALQHLGTKRKEVERIRVFENLLGKLGLLGRQGPRKIGQRIALTGEKIAVDLVGEDVAAPVVFDRLPGIPSVPPSAAIFWKSSMIIKLPVWPHPDFEWRVIESLLPNKLRGVPRVDDRRVLHGIFWVLRSSAPWRAVARPARTGPRTTCYNRFARWRRSSKSACGLFVSATRLISAV